MPGRGARPVTGAPLLFPLGEYWWLYAAFVGVVLALLALDLGVFHREPHRVRFREAVAWCVTWIILALLFNGALYAYGLWAFPQDPRLTAIPGFDHREAAWQVALEFLAGYLIEYSLSVDNIFVFVLVLGYFRIPAQYQHRVLFYGILGALIFRAIFVALGSLLMQFHWIVWLFGAVPRLHRRQDGGDLRRVDGPRAQPSSSACCAGSCR